MSADISAAINPQGVRAAGMDSAIPAKEKDDKLAEPMIEPFMKDGFSASLRLVKINGTMVLQIKGDPTTCKSDDWSAIFAARDLGDAEGWISVLDNVTHYEITASGFTANRSYKGVATIYAEMHVACLDGSGPSGFEDDGWLLYPEDTVTTSSGCVVM